MDRKKARNNPGFVVLELFHTETFFESVNTTAGINEFLTTSVERMAFGANLYVDVFFGGTGFPNSAASAGNGGGFVIRMKTFFHLCHLFLYRAYITSPFFTSVLISYHNRTRIATIFFGKFIPNSIFLSETEHCGNFCLNCFAFGFCRFKIGSFYGIIDFEFGFGSGRTNDKA